MKILMLHNRYKLVGGEDISTDGEVQLLQSKGVNVETFYISNNVVDNTNKLKLAWNTIWSKKYYEELVEKIKAEKYDLVHVQNFFPLFSPSIFYACNKVGTKIIMSVHNYRLVCPNALMYINNSICQDCVGKTVPYPALLKKCYRDSYSSTAVTVAMLGIHNLLKTWNTKIDGFICISQFVKNQLLLANFDRDKLFIKPNFVSVEIPPVFTPEDYYIYVGRISTEKGIDLLLKTFESNNKKLLIIGDGPLKQQVIDAASKHDHITYLGQLSLSDTYKKIANAKALIFPSKCHETFGRTIIEAFAHGTPVIGASMGGATELIQHGINGFLFNPYLEKQLEETINVFEHSYNTGNFRHNAYLSYKTNYNPDSNFMQLTSIYNQILSGNSNPLA